VEVAPRFFELDAQFADMNAAGVDVMVSSPSPQYADAARLPRDRALELVASLNNATAAAQREHPARFIGLAVLPMGHPEAAAAMVQHVTEDLGLRGVCLFSNVAGGRLVTEATMPVFAAIAAAEIPIFLHPTRSAERLDAMWAPIESGLNWMHDTSVAALSFIERGVLDAFPQLEIVHPHAGGVLPYLLERLELVYSGIPQDRPALRLRDYLRSNFYVDTVNHTPGALEMAANTYGPDRVLFATDYPYVPRKTTIDFLRANGHDQFMSTAGPARLQLIAE
jgi:predicted TIM-barrel fold metal-dependent hydrolase